MMMSKATIVFIVYFIQGTLGLDQHSQIVVSGKSYAVNIEDVPFMATAHIGGNICGGSIIQKQFVLTAAHCILKTSDVSDYVRVGSNKRNLGGRKYSIEKYIPHEQYYDGNPSKINYDIGLLKLTRSLTFSASVAPIKLAFSNLVHPGMTTFVSGWRQIVPGTLKLYDISVTVTPLSTCINYYENNWLSEKTICGDDSSAGICSGDRGGPLIVGDRQVGIYSTGGDPDYCGYYPGVYVNVTAHIDWVYSKLN